MSELLTKLRAAITVAKQADQAAIEGWDRIYKEICRLLDECGGCATTSPEEGYSRKYTRIAGDLYGTSIVSGLPSNMRHQHVGNRIFELEEEGKGLNQDNSKQREQVRLLLSDLLGPSLAFHLLK